MLLQAFQYTQHPITDEQASPTVDEELPPIHEAPGLGSAKEHAVGHAVPPEA